MRWSKVPVTITKEYALVDEDGNDAPECLGLKSSVTLALNVESSGESSPGRIGTPDNCDPPYHDEERLLVSATVDGKLVADAVLDELAELFAEEIDALEFSE